jgi:hypothetical protein
VVLEASIPRVLDVVVVDFVVAAVAVIVALPFV